ncbi:probable FPR1 - peptidyl-prolyl cis-trans isomerase, FK506-binding protein [Ustilago trichophora]|uniref:peptidylprolyl isomerase n=1 Tax=Ustilago trichophora TaxID=86804 RepID=A0A5C3ECR1_9BASI|nr:probable FPR1 - peptidyl-prolyl cis-trans isomerase, FK506-binding protein [Ustilago trichophora]
MVQIERITPGDGKSFPKAGDTVTMHYTGTLAANGEEFDSSRKPGRGPFETAIGVGRVIQGWDQGVPQLSLGERAKLIIPANEGYGARGAGGVIPPNADLIFDVELLAINGKSVPNIIYINQMLPETQLNPIPNHPQPFL